VGPRACPRPAPPGGNRPQGEMGEQPVMSGPREGVEQPDLVVVDRRPCPKRGQTRRKQRGRARQDRSGRPTSVELTTSLGQAPPAAGLAADNHPADLRILWPRSPGRRRPSVEGAHRRRLFGRESPADLLGIIGQPMPPMGGVTRRAAIGSQLSPDRQVRLNPLLRGPRMRDRIPGAGWWRPKPDKSALAGSSRDLRRRLSRDARVPPRRRRSAAATFLARSPVTGPLADSGPANWRMARRRN